MDEIKRGDRVEYIDAESMLVNGRVKTVKVPKYGIWDGEKVILETKLIPDPEKTTVRNKKWLKKV
mgnify:CR=1 FL=1